MIEDCDSKLTPRRRDWHGITSGSQSSSPPDREESQNSRCPESDGVTVFSSLLRLACEAPAGQLSLVNLGF